MSRTAQGVADYVYTAQTYILGQGSSPGTLQTLPLTSTLVHHAGRCAWRYWANPFDSVVGGRWWGTAYVAARRGAQPSAALDVDQRPIRSPTS